jgi:hypothetical protein
VPSDEQGEDYVDQRRHEKRHRDVLANLDAGHPQDKRRQTECDQGWDAIVNLPWERMEPEVGVSCEGHACYHYDCRKDHK